MVVKKKTSEAKQSLTIWKDSYFEVRAKIEASGRDARWEFDRKRLFERTDYMAKICEDLYEVAQVINRVIYAASTFQKYVIYSRSNEIYFALEIFKTFANCFILASRAIITPTFIPLSISISGHGGILQHIWTRIESCDWGPEKDRRRFETS